VSMMWKDTLLPGASRVPVPVGTPGSVADFFGTPTGRMDFVMGPGGVPVISGSSEAQGGGGGPSPGFDPVDPGQYGSNPFFAGRSSLSSAVAAPQGALGTYGKTSAAELQALLKMLGQLDLGSLLGSAAPAVGGGLRIAE
jgi:hypothetical protein